jgi:hypothetical protein
VAVSVALPASRGGVTAKVPEVAPAGTHAEVIVWVKAGSTPAGRVSSLASAALKQGDLQVGERTGGRLHPRVGDENPPGGECRSQRTNDEMRSRPNRSNPRNPDSRKKAKTPSAASGAPKMSPTNRE